MKNTKLYIFSKKIHRFLVIVIIIMGLAMALTGLFMYTGNYFSFNPVTVRILHHQLSIFYAFVFGLMALTGFYQFLFPYLR